MSYDAFDANYSLLRTYLKGIDYHIIDDKTNILKEDKVLPQVDFVSMTCPCAGLSLLNYSGTSEGGTKRGSDASQNDWIYKSTEFVLENLKPKVVFGENAPGLYGEMGKGVVENLKVYAEKYGYTLSLYKTSTMYHGIPQNRMRTFYFFWKGDKVPIFNYYRNNEKTFTEYITEIPEDASLQDWYYSELKPGLENTWISYMKYKFGNEWREKTKKSGSILDYISKNNLMEDGLNWYKTIYDNRDGEKSYLFLKMMNRVISKNKEGKGWWDISPLIHYDYTRALITKLTNLLHPIEERGLNMREALHMMGMPHDFEVPDAKHKYFQKLTQNVPVCTARDMTLEVIRFLNGESELLETPFVMQNNLNQKVEYPNLSKKPEKVKSISLF
jgi:site-specific DNA-cytosine methylase